MPFNCSFCGVHAAYGREKMESPARTVSILKHLVASMAPIPCSSTI